LGRILQRNNKRIRDFLKFLICKFGKIAKLSKPKNWEKKKKKTTSCAALVNLLLLTRSQLGEGNSSI
jgi:hypothetical protein